MDYLLGPLELRFLLMIVLAVGIGFVIGAERELRGKDAGISTHILVIAGAALFSFLSGLVEPTAASRIASSIVTGMGFLGAGIILRDVKDGDHVRNLTTAASLWFSAALGMAIGFGYFTIAIIGGIACVLIPLIPSIRRDSRS